MMANPSYYTDELFQQKLRRGGEELDDQFTMRNRLLKEEMARRGLGDSSIYGGRSRDLNVERRTAGVDLMERLAEEQARAMQEGRTQAIGLGLQLSAQDMQARQNELQNQLAQMQMELTREVEAGRMTIEQARLQMQQAQLAYQQESDALDRQFRQSEADRSASQYQQEFGYRGESDAADRAWREQRAAAEDAWREGAFDWEKDAWKRNYDLDVLRLYGIDTADYGDQPTAGNPTGGGTGYTAGGNTVTSSAPPPISVQSGYTGGGTDPYQDPGRYPGDPMDDLYGPAGPRR